MILPDVTLLLRVLLRLGFSVVSDAERYPGGNGITSGSMSKATMRDPSAQRHRRETGGQTRGHTLGLVEEHPRVEGDQPVVKFLADHRQRQFNAAFPPPICRSATTSGA